MEKKTNHTTKKEEKTHKEHATEVKIEDLKKESMQEENTLLVEEPHDARNLMILLGIIIGTLALIFGGMALYNNFNQEKVIDIDELHTQNLQNKLSEEEGYMYNGFSFVKADGLWWTELSLGEERVKIPLHFGPKEVEFVQVTGTLDAEFNYGDEVYMTIDPKVSDKYYTLALSELSFNMAKGLKRSPVGACTETNWACDNRTIMSCANNTENRPLIELAVANETSIELIGSCIKISGQEYNITKAVDRLLYQWYGVIKDEPIVETKSNFWPYVTIAIITVGLVAGLIFFIVNRRNKRVKN